MAVLPNEISFFGLTKKTETKKVKADGPFERKLRIENTTQSNSSFLLKQDDLLVPPPDFRPCFLIQNLRRPYFSPYGEIGPLPLIIAIGVNPPNEKRDCPDSNDLGQLKN